MSIRERLESMERRLGGVPERWALVALARRRGVEGVAALLSRARELRAQSRWQECHRCGEAAAEVAEQLGQPALVARAHAETANALRRLGRFGEARVRFEGIEPLLVDLAPLDRAEVLSLWASLDRDLRRYGAAEKRLYDALFEAADAGAEALRTRLLVQLGAVLADAGERQGALDADLVAMRGLLPDSQDMELVGIVAANAVGNLIDAAAEADQEERRFLLLQASASVANARSVIAAFGKPIHALQLEWTEARLLHYHGNRERARVAFERLIGAFLEQDAPYYSAISALDLCQIHCEDGDPVRLRKTATAAAATLAGCELTDDLWAALHFLKAAEDLDKARAVILTAVGRCGAPALGAPRGIIDC